MRLKGFANPKDYAPTVADADDFLNQILLIWPDRLADEFAPFVLGSRKQPPIKRMTTSETLSIGSHVGGIHHRDRRGASQWPTA
jgi:hypothetical protein